MEQLVERNTALLAKELGFDEPVQDRYFKGVVLNGIGERRFGGISNWNHDCFQDEFRQYVSAPTQGHLQKWLREKQDSIVTILTRPLSDGLYWTNNFQVTQVNAEMFVTYEEALEDGMVNLMKIKLKSEV